MKTLLLLRHAQTQPSARTGDKDRALTAQGLQEAMALGHRMRTDSLIPDLILCSSARRTQETFENLAKAANIRAQPVIMPAIYAADDAQDLISIIQKIDSQSGMLLLIGHNPAIHGLAVQCAFKNSGVLTERIFEDYAPATLSVFEHPSPLWSDFDPSKCRVRALLRPIDYNQTPPPPPAP